MTLKKQGVTTKKQEDNQTASNITTFINPMPSTKQELCPSCNGLGSFQTNYYSQTITTNCNTCKGFGTLTICTSCQAQVSFTRYGVVCGCNSASLKVAA